MRCPSCGARYDNPSVRCPECGALQNEVSENSSASASSGPANNVKETPSTKTITRKPSPPKRTRSLIEFPGVNRNARPQWRKELGERVRKVQGKRAKEAILETSEVGPLFSEPEPKTPPVLELLPQNEIPPTNPLVVAALRRIERAHSQPGGNTAVETAVAYEEQPTLEPNSAADPAIDEPVSKPERTHSLAVVPTQEVITTEIPQEPIAPEPKKPRRLIDDRNDPALNYLDSIPTAVRLERLEYRSAPLFRRMFGALADLAVVGFLSLPFLALTELTNLEWQNPRVIGFAVGTYLVVGFLYLTVSVALTGRTIGMKLFSLRVVDARTGLIPTGGQSAGRSLVYLLSFASAGIAFMYTFIDREKQSVHDRFARTAVIRS